MNFTDTSDDGLLKLVHSGSSAAQDYIIEKYKPLVRIKARAYFIAGADYEDVIQEGMIGLYKAIRDFKPEKGVLFSTFAEVCVVRQIFDAIKASTRKKHSPLNSYISLSNQEENPVFSESQSLNPLELIIGMENKDYIEKQLQKKLSTFEYKILNYYLVGSSYAEIAAAIGKDEKAVENALGRIRKKVEKMVLKA